MIGETQRSHGLLLFVVSVVILKLATGVLFSLITPPWQAPDEPRHFEYVKVLADKRRILAISDTNPEYQREILQSMMDSDFFRWHWRPRPQTAFSSFMEMWPGQETMLHRPSLYYPLALPFFALASSGTVVDQLHASRLTSAILGALTVVVAFFTARALFPEDNFMAVGTTTFVATVPMFSYISGTLSVDNLSALLGGVLALCIAVVFRRGMTWGNMLLATLMVGLSLATKRSGVGQLLMLLVVPIVYVWGRRDRVAKGVIWGSFALLALAAAVIAAISWEALLPYWLLRLVRNYLLVSRELTSRYFDTRYLSWEFVQILWSYAETATGSFWARFGWMVLPVDEVWYSLLKVAHLVTAVGLGWLLLRAIQGKQTLMAWQWKALIVYALAFAALVGLAIAEFAYWFTPTRAPQGRYFFVLIVPIGMMFVLGWREALPARWRPIGALVMNGFLLVFTSACLLWYMVGWFRWAL